MKRFLLLIIGTLLAVNANAQNVLLEEDPAVDTTTETKGPNLKDFFQTYYGYGNFIGGRKAGSDVSYKSYSLTAGVRYKRKVSEWYSLGADFAYTNNTYVLKQQDGKTLPDTILHKKERLSWMYFSLGVFNRFNFAKRGNVLGTYLDLGVEAGYSFSFTHFYYDRTDDGRSLKTRVRGLNYFEPFYYSAFARMGKDRFALCASYRLSNLLKSKYNYQQLPPFCLSLQLSIY